MTMPGTAATSAREVLDRHVALLNPYVYALQWQHG
jgi:hypothetical protein